MIERIKESISNLLLDNKIELIDISYKRERGSLVLRILVDKAGGITLDDCTYLNEEIGKILDNENVIPEAYLLEVNSPGVDRPLKTKKDFERIVGQKINVHTYEPINGKRDFNGRVEAVDDDCVVVNRVKIPLDKISKAKREIVI